MIQYEYKTILLKGRDAADFNTDFTKKLNLLGREGWELILSVLQPCLGSYQYSLVGVTQKLTLIFKRQVQQSQFNREASK